MVVACWESMNLQFSSISAQAAQACGAWRGSTHPPSFHSHLEWVFRLSVLTLSYSATAPSPGMSSLMTASAQSGNAPEKSLSEKNRIASKHGASSSKSSIFPNATFFASAGTYEGGSLTEEEVPLKSKWMNTITVCEARTR